MSGRISGRSVAASNLLMDLGNGWPLFDFRHPFWRVDLFLAGKLVLLSSAADVFGVCFVCFLGAGGTNAK